MTKQEKKYTLYVRGMHCNACTLLIENEIGNLPNITYVKSHLKNNSVEFEGDFGNKSLEQIAQEFTRLLAPHEYTFSTEKQNENKKWSDFIIAIPIALGCILLFVFLQKIGIVEMIHAEKVTYGTAFLIGIVASLSTCMAVVGGLLLSLSATFAKGNGWMRSQIMFHVGRIITFFLFGGVLGSIGSVFTLSEVASFMISFIVSFVMLILGINLLEVAPWMKRLQPTIPKFIIQKTQGILKMKYTITPLFVGMITFFLPCGFTQSMQFYTLSTKSFLEGGLTMFSFALGTLPILALISFSPWGIQSGKIKSGIFFKVIGLIVVSFALFNVINSFVAIGLISPVFNF